MLFRSDVFAHASMREGISVASLEAMYCGLPLVMSTVRGAEDYLTDGESGFLRNAMDVAGFADGIRRLKEDAALRRACGQKNRETVQVYTMDSVKQEILMLFHGYL